MTNSFRKRITVAQYTSSNNESISKPSSIISHIAVNPINKHRISIEIKHPFNCINVRDMTKNLNCLYYIPS